MSRRGRFPNLRRAFRRFLDFSLRCMCLEGCYGRRRRVSEEPCQEEHSIEGEDEEDALSYATLERAQVKEAPVKETSPVGSIGEEEDGAVSHVILVRALIHAAPEKETPLLGGSTREKVDECTLANARLAGAGIQDAVGKETAPIGGSSQEEAKEDAPADAHLARAEIPAALGKEAAPVGVEEDLLPAEHTVSRCETCKFQTIRAGTLEKLVESLVRAFEDKDFAYISIFLSTYRAFASAKEVLELLLDRYGSPETPSFEEVENKNSSGSKAVVRIATASILGAWLNQCSEDFREPPNYPCLLKMLDYLKKNVSGSDPERRAQSLLQQFQNQEMESDDEFRNASSSNQCGEEELEICSPEEFSSFQESLVAEQLTYMDAELFKKVVPHHCLGCIWSQRHKKENKHVAPTIRATVSQFNAVTNCVVSTILNNKELKPQQRAKIMEKWIRIAHECRILKNFSSLRAIISALQSHSIYRLKKTWACIPKDTMLMFEELGDIFSDRDNYLAFRKLLMKEGTSKFANLDSSVKENRKRTQKRLQRQKDLGVMQGTVPYLGIFLTDLVMLDTALPDYVEGGLINFEKRRREFEVITQIKILQAACNTYCLAPEEKFILWFKRQQQLTEKESYDLSCEAEAAAGTSTASRKPRKSLVKRFRL